MKQQMIPIFFPIDDKYVYYVSTAITSLIENASKEYDYKIYVLYENVTEKDLDYITSLADGHNNFKIKPVDVQKHLARIEKRANELLKAYHLDLTLYSLTIYYRLFIAEMLQGLDKGIYIDSDIIVLGDISELYNIDLEDNVIGACPDPSVSKVPEFVDYIENSVGVKTETYINSGVLLMDFKKLRENDFPKKFLYLLDKYHFECVAPDQDYINAMCHDKILYLDKLWDVMPDADKKEIKNPKIIHYNLLNKPWKYDNIQYEEYFWKYAKKVKYYNDIIKSKKDYSDEQKKADGEYLKQFIHRAGLLVHNDVTFKKIFESGENIRI